MTIICALHEPEKQQTWIGSDTLAADNDTCLNVGPKWIVHGGWGVGIAGDWRTYNIIETNTGKLFGDLDGAEDFVQRLRPLFKEEGFNSDSEEGPKSYGQQMILAAPIGLWAICAALSHKQCLFWADGTGQAFALGAGYALLERGVSAKEIIGEALAAAIQYDRGSGGEPWVDCLKSGTK